MLKNVNHHLRLQWVILFLLAKGLASTLVASDWWSGGGWSFWFGCGCYLKQDKSEGCCTQILPFTNDFSVACGAVGWHFAHSRTPSKTGVDSHKLCCFINKVYLIFQILCYLNNLHQDLLGVGLLQTFNL